MQFLSFNVTPFLPAESIISDYVSVKVFSARLSLTVASSSSLCGPEAQQKQHYADPPSEPCCCRETGLQTALSLTFLLICAVTMQGEFIMPDKILNVDSPLWESSIAISPIMFTCRCSCQKWHGSHVSLDLSDTGCLRKPYCISNMRSQSAHLCYLLKGEFSMQNLSSMLSHILPIFFSHGLSKEKLYPLPWIYWWCVCVFVWIFATVTHRAVRWLVKDPYKLQGPGSGFSTFVSVGAPSHTRSHTFSSLEIWASNLV